MRTRQPFTRRKKQIIALRCAHGMTNRAIGNALGISPQTVKNHFTRILSEYREIKQGEVSVERICLDVGIELGRRGNADAEITEWINGGPA